MRVDLFILLSHSSRSEVYLYDASDNLLLNEISDIFELICVLVFDQIGGRTKEHAFFIRINWVFFNNNKPKILWITVFSNYYI